jgi:hypothetical protein
MPDDITISDFDDYNSTLYINLPMSDSPTNPPTTSKPPLPTTLPQPPIDPNDPIELDSIPSENSDRDITLIDSINPLTSDVVLTTTTTQTTTTPTTPTTLAPNTTVIPLECEEFCKKLGY